MKLFVMQPIPKFSLIRAGAKGWCPVCEDEGSIQSCCNRCHMRCDC